jgi:hypothetical protein
MNIQPGLKRWIWISAVLLAVAGTTLAGIQGTGFRAFAAFGTVEAGSGLRVNGVPYDTSHANVVVNGRRGVVAQLRTGQIVAVHGSISKDASSAIADEIVMESDVRGEVTSVDKAHGVFSVLGQTIRLTEQSVLDPQIQPNNLDGLRSGVWVKVSAFERSDGSFVASRVDLDLAPGESQLRGVVQSVDLKHLTLRMGGLSVDYSNAEAEGVIAEGAVVIVRGLQLQPHGVLFASHLEVFSGVGQGAEHGDVQGIVSAFASPLDFEVNGQPVLADSKTVYVLHGQSIGPDLQVRVTGRFDTSGVLIAHKIQADAPNKGKSGLTIAR